MALSAWSTVATVIACLTEVVKKTSSDNGHIPGALFFIYLGAEEGDMSTCSWEATSLTLVVLLPVLASFVVYNCLKSR